MIQKQRMRRDDRAKELSEGFKTCPKCKVRKPVSDYGANKGRPDGLQHACKECCKVGAWAWRYGITPEEFSALISKQDGRCGMCLEPCTDWCVDHDHGCCPGYRSCGFCIRGLLCGRCNRSLGHFEKVRKQAEAYLTKVSP